MNPGIAQKLKESDVDGIAPSLGNDHVVEIGLRFGGMPFIDQLFPGILQVEPDPDAIVGIGIKTVATGFKIKTTCPVG